MMMRRIKMMMLMMLMMAVSMVTGAWLDPQVSHQRSD